MPDDVCKASTGVASASPPISLRTLPPVSEASCAAWPTELEHDAATDSHGGAPSAVRLYHRFCGAGKAHFCSHARPGKPPKFDDRSR